MVRRSPRALLLWTGAVAVTLVTALVVGTDLSSLHRRARDLGPARVVAVATRDLAVGLTIEPGDVDRRVVHQSQLPPGALHPDATGGRIVTVPVLRDGFVTTRNLAPAHRRDLDAVVPPGMRIVRVAVSEPTDALGIGASHVDVMATFDPGAAVDDEGNPADDPTVVVARGALVVDRNDGTGAGSFADRATNAGVAVLVTQAEARAVAYANAVGVVTLALVPPEDARARIPT